MFPGFVYSAPVDTLGSGEVHLWQLSIKDVLRTQSIGTLCYLLSEDERGRAAAYRSDSRRQLFIIGRAGLRLILSALMPGIPPQSIRFTTGAEGKPMLEDASCPLQFNLSHSHDAIVIAVTTGQTVGVDIENMKARSRMADIAQHYFHPQEAQVITEALAAGDEQSALRLFYKVWTLKEAFIKADGKGMAIPGDSFYFYHIDTSCPRIELTDYEADVAPEWYFKHQFADAQYSIALALSVANNEKSVTVVQRQLSLMETDWCS